MASLLLRILIAAVVVLVLLAILPAFLHLLGAPVSGDLWTIIRAVVAGLALLYVVLGPPVANPLS